MVIERREWLARLALVLILIGLPLVALASQYALRPALSETRIIDIRMTVPETRGFSQDVIQVSVEEPVTLRFAADDVTHGIAIGPGLGVDLGSIDPGEVGEITLKFDHPGTYTYYCTTWCSPNHWRMRGQIQVRDIRGIDVIPTAQTDSVIANLQAEGVSLDDARTEFEPLIGIDLEAFDAPGFDDWKIPDRLANLDWRHTHSPAEAGELLQFANPQRAAEDVYRVVAYLWLENDTDSSIDVQYLYNQNCAACHGQTGLGDGPGATFTPVQPAAFGNVAYMFTMRSDVMYAKIRRGGMGTDMPNFGTIFTPEESWALVDYLWGLAFGDE